MAHWFHRNPIKPTEMAKYELKGVLTKDSCSKICSELRLRRERILTFLRNAGSELIEVDKEVTEYLSLFYGFLYEITDEPPADGDLKNSKLVPLITTKWGHSMLVNTATIGNESWFEYLNLIQTYAIWLTKHAAWVAGKDEVRDDEAKEVLTCLRRATGMFAYVGENAGRLSGSTDLEGSDFDSKVMRAYELQANAEAQEIIIARAIEQKHNPTLISSISANTAGIFAKADQQLATFPDDIFSRWRKYLLLKHHLYLSYGFAFMGESMLKEDKCGDAVRACREGISEFKIASELATQYATAPGPGSRIKPEQHLFFRRIEPLLKRHLEKAERENGFIYHQKVPDECPQLDANATYGITKAEKFEMPKPAQNWTPAVYAAFDLTKADMPDFSKIKKSKTKIDPVKEEKIYQTEKDPNNSSGCTVM